MKVSFFKNITNTAPTHSKDVAFYLDRIKNGASASIISKLRNADNDEDRKKIKLSLPVVCFNGEFIQRNAKGLKKPSGLMVLDFDDVDNADDFKKTLSKDPHVFAAWGSPSGGVKALYRVAPTPDQQYFKEVFLRVLEKYPKLDATGKDISRACFESYDPEIYINLDAIEFVPDIKQTAPNLDIGVITSVPLQDQDVIANRLMVWFKNKNKFNPSARNNSIFVLASAFNSFGVSQSTALNYCLQYEQADFKRDEIERVVISAYKNTTDFNTKFFEDEVKKKEVEFLILRGYNDSDIQKQFPEIKKDGVSELRKNVNPDEFWKYDKDGKIKLAPLKFKYYLENKNFFKYYPIEKSKTFTFISKTDDVFIDEVSEYQIKDFALNKMLEGGNSDVFDLLAASQRSFTPNFLSMLETAKINIQEDAPDNALLYYKNCAVKVYKDSIEEISYNNLDGFVWKKQVIDREFNRDVDHHPSEFRTFLWFCASENPKKYKSLQSVIGYLLHSFKNNANNKAIVFNDEQISENPNGGSGKSLIWNAISNIKKVSSIDGKTFEFTKSFPYQSVPTDTQILVFDDVKKNFNFESLFSLITEGITLEYKGQDAIKLPVSKSPKILITTNYTIGGDGGSFERRKFEVELGTYFNHKHTPLDEFGHMMFDDWSDLEWSRFDKFMINCLQIYLKNGLIPFELANLHDRKFMNETCPEFAEWSAEDGNIMINFRYGTNDLYEKFISDFPDFVRNKARQLSVRAFNKWLEKYCLKNDFKLDKFKTNGLRYMEIVSDKHPQNENHNDNDLAF
jgi:hypothetical protein